MPVEPEQVLFASERVLWTGRPQRARRSLQEIGLALYVTVVTPVICVIGLARLLKPPVLRPLTAIAVTFMVAGVFQAVGYLVYLLATLPAMRAGARYAVTDRRVVVTMGSRARTARTWRARSFAIPDRVSLEWFGPWNSGLVAAARPGCGSRCSR